VSDAIEAQPVIEGPTREELMAEVERLKGHHSKLLDETKSAKQKAAELDKANQDAEIQRQTEQGEFKSLAEKYKQEADAERKSSAEFRAAIASEKMESAAMRIAIDEANDPKNAKLLARFIRDQLDYVDGKVTGKDGQSIEDTIKAMLATGDFESLRKGIDSSGGSAIGSNKGSGATKKFEEYDGAELKALRQADPQTYDRISADYKARTKGY
jgi:FtsZ-binding cell division protein ZapB